MDNRILRAKKLADLRNSWEGLKGYRFGRRNLRARGVRCLLTSVRRNAFTGRGSAIKIGFPSILGQPSLRVYEARASFGATRWLHVPPKLFIGCLERNRSTGNASDSVLVISLSKFREKGEIDGEICELSMLENSLIREKWTLRVTVLVIRKAECIVHWKMFNKEL